MMEQTKPCKCHRHPVFVTGLDHIVVSHGSARLRDILHTASVRPLNIIPEREERI